MSTVRLHPHRAAKAPYSFPLPLAGQAHARELNAQSGALAGAYEADE